LNPAHRLSPPRQFLNFCERTIHPHPRGQLTYATRTIREGFAAPEGRALHIETDTPRAAGVVRDLRRRPRLLVHPRWQAYDLDRPIKTVLARGGVTGTITITVNHLKTTCIQATVRHAAGTAGHRVRTTSDQAAKLIDIRQMPAAIAGPTQARAVTHRSRPTILGQPLRCAVLPHVTRGRVGPDAFVWKTLRGSGAIIVYTRLGS
jgi:hypothetical protein